MVLLSAGAQFAAEHHGLVKFGGLPVPGATVTVTQGNKKLVAVADPQGAYSFADLADGIWKIRVEMLCFAGMEQEISVAPNAPSPQWELKLLPMDEIKAASAASGGNSGVTTSIVSRPGLPAAPQQTQAADAAPPAKPESPTAARRPARNAKTNGAAPAQNPQAGFQRTDLKASADPATLGEGETTKENASDSLLFNGSVNNAAVSPFGQSAAFGNARKGTGPRYNFALGATAGNAALDARSFSLTGQPTPKPAYNHLQGTATLGGPLVIPHLLPLTRTSPNFNIGYQWVRNRNATTKSSLMPSTAERSGDLSQSINALGQPVQFFDPNTAAPFPGNVIPQNRISPQAKVLLALYPLPNFSTAGRYNHQVPIVGTNNSDGIQTRVNKTLNNKNQMFGTFAWQRTYGENPNLFGFRDTTAGSGINSGVNWTHRFTQRVFSNLRLDYSRSSTRNTPYFANLRNISGEAAITGNNQEPVNWGPPTLSFSGGIEALSDGQASFIRNQTAGVGGSIFWNHRSHNFQAGADARRQQFNAISQQNARGTFGFTGADTQVISNGVGVPGTGSDFADFLLGVPDTSAIAFGNADKYFRAGMYDGYFTDDWRVRSGFTLNAGVRWEYGSPLTELYGRLVNLDIAPGFAAVAPVLASGPAGTLTGQRYADSLVRPDKHGIQPRIAIAWHPFSASSMVVRAGYGVYYDTSVYGAIANRMAQQSPLSKSLSVQNSPGNPLTLASGFIASPATTTNTFAIDPNFRVGYSQNWQISVQRDMPGSLVMTATYLGIKGTRAQQQFLPNTFPSGAVNPCPACPVGYAYLTSNGNSTRHSGMMQIRRRLHNGFTATMQYTFAKSIDDAALGGRGQGGAAVIAQDWLNLSGERGLSSFDQRHLLNLQIQYTSGIGVRGGTLLSGWRGTAFKGWTITSNISDGSGLPLTPGYSAAVKGTGVTGSIRPSYTGIDLYAAPPGLFLNPAALLAPAAGQWGNAGRNSITGPGQFTLNASMSRSFHEGYIDFRIDATNALNHVVFPSWNANITSAQFGLPVSANAMRTVQASLRIRIF